MTMHYRRRDHLPEMFAAAYRMRCDAAGAGRRHLVDRVREPAGSPTNNYRTVDDQPLRWWPGMVMLPEPLESPSTRRRRSRVGRCQDRVYLAPGANPLDHGRVIRWVRPEPADDTLILWAL